MWCKLLSQGHTKKTFYTKYKFVQGSYGMLLSSREEPKRLMSCGYDIDQWPQVCIKPICIRVPLDFLLLAFELSSSSFLFILVTMKHMGIGKWKTNKPLWYAFMLTFHILYVDIYLVIASAIFQSCRLWLTTITQLTIVVNTICFAAIYHPCHKSITLRILHM